MGVVHKVLNNKINFVFLVTCLLYSLSYAEKELTNYLMLLIG